MRHPKSLEEVLPSKKGGLIQHIIPLCSDYSLYFWHKMSSFLVQAGELHHRSQNLLVLVCMFIIHTDMRGVNQSCVNAGRTQINLPLKPLRPVCDWVLIPNQTEHRESERAGRETLHLTNTGPRSCICSSFSSPVTRSPCYFSVPVLCAASVSCLSSIFFFFLLSSFVL